jgi:hypothetical protein
MFQTVEAIYDPNKGLTFTEAVQIDATVKVLVTFVEEPCRPAAKGTPQALLAALQSHPLPASAALSDAEIEAQIQEVQESWEA